MALYQKVDDVWVLCQTPYVKRNGVYVPVEEAWVKRSGSWVIAYDADVTPPNPPEITLRIVEDFATVKGVKTLQSRWIAVGVRISGASNDPDASMVRVLTNFNGKPPTTQFGGTYTTTPDKTYPGEKWSEWTYNKGGEHNDTSVVNAKQWPPNASAGYTIPGDKDYYFTGWSLDNSGNWSVATAASIHVPKDSKDVPNVITNEAGFQANSGGSWRTAGFQGGKLIQQNSPRSQGLWFYGNQMRDAIGAKGPATIKSAQIRIEREKSDTGAANANIYLFWTTYGTAGALPAVGGALVRNDMVKLGALAKGQAKWFPLPNSFNADFKAGNIKGMGLSFKDPDKAAAAANDFSTVVSVGENLRSGEIHMVWEETL